jgi:hypothetical protein
MAGCRDQLEKKFRPPLRANYSLAESVGASIGHRAQPPEALLSVRLERLTPAPAIRFEGRDNFATASTASGL